MPLFREYRGFEVHLDEGEDGTYIWSVHGYGKARANGKAERRQDAFFAACEAIDAIEDDPYKFPINLVGYSSSLEGEVVTKDGEVLGRWTVSDDGGLEVVSFIPEENTGILFQDHRVGILCMNILDWFEATELR